MEMVVLGHGPLPLVHLDRHRGLVVRVGGERLSLLGGDGGVPLDQRGHHSSSGLDAEGQRGNVEEQEIRHGLGLVACRLEY